jgi:hypothetical protein
VQHVAAGQLRTEKKKDMQSSATHRVNCQLS